MVFRAILHRVATKLHLSYLDTIPTTCISGGRFLRAFAFDASGEVPCQMAPATNGGILGVFNVLRITHTPYILRTYIFILNRLGTNNECVRSLHRRVACKYDRKQNPPENMISCIGQCYYVASPTLFERDLNTVVAFKISIRMACFPPNMG